jgi:5-methylcytosine-specific restriction endonuclease McrA
MDAGVTGNIVSRNAALSADLTRYFTGEPCKNGHVAERRTNDKRCVECLSEKWHRRYALHSARYKATAKRHYKAKSELMKDRSRRWYHEHLDWAKARRKRYYHQHRDELIAAVARWVAENPERARANHINRKLRRRGIVGSIAGSDILALMRQQGGKCFCGTGLMDGFTVDHVIPLCNGGTNLPENIQLLCAECNADKGRKSDADWKSARGFLEAFS